MKEERVDETGAKVVTSRKKGFIKAKTVRSSSNSPAPIKVTSAPI